ncbi:hypothetical protein [Chitinophaga vietnamensis]|uniref:hypothetical protein n=1 Tax=Chitinophaga vietnamensis TaxID=2593957 RepID=UPI001178029D|nr:hypothetical protein [Chitinophaga vietnamensis]
MQKIITLFILFLAFSFKTLAQKAHQDDYDPALKMYVYTFVETPPQFPGGDEALTRFISKRVYYPKEQETM